MSRRVASVRKLVTFVEIKTVFFVQVLKKKAIQYACDQ